MKKNLTSEIIAFFLGVTSWILLVSTFHINDCSFSDRVVVLNDSIRIRYEHQVEGNNDHLILI